MGEETIMPDAMEAAREHVKQEAADELVDSQRHRLAAGAALNPIVLPGERHAAVVGADQGATRPISRRCSSSSSWI